MPLRIVPFGYCVRKGKNELDEIEHRILNQIYDMRLEEKSLSAIMVYLLENQIPYSADSMAWNKAKLMRILKDRRYLGDDEFPQAIVKDKFDAVQRIGTYHKDRQDSAPLQEVKELRSLVVCGSCGNPMRRRYERKAKKQPVRWICQNPNCKMLVVIKDEELKEAIQKILNRIRTGDVTKNRASSFFIPTNEIQRQEKALLRRIDHSRPEEAETLREMVWDLAMQKYLQCMDDGDEFDRIQALFQNADEQGIFDAGLVKQSVSQIILGPEDNIRLRLKDGQTLQGEMEREVKERRCRKKEIAR